MSLRVWWTRLFKYTNIRDHWILLSLISPTDDYKTVSSPSLENATWNIGAHTAILCSFISNPSLYHLYLSVQTCYWPTSWRNSCDFNWSINAACETFCGGSFNRISSNWIKKHVAFDEVEHRMNSRSESLGYLDIP